MDQPADTARQADRLLSAHLRGVQRTHESMHLLDCTPVRPWPLLGIFLALVTQVWNVFNHGLLVWGSAFIAQMIMLAYNQTLREIYNAVRYIEREVRPAVQALVGEESIWRYESYYAAQPFRRGLPWEYAIPVLLFVALVAVFFARPLRAVDAIGGTINLVFFGVVAWQTRVLVGIRRDFFPNNSVR